jgi:hypothetical protein
VVPDHVRRMHKYRNRPLSKQLSFDFLTSFPFCGKRNISMGTWEHRKLGRSLSIHPLGFFCWGRSLKTHRENIKGVVSGFED